jgi:hypothetical protein
MRSISPQNLIDQCLYFSGRNTSPDWSRPNRCVLGYNSTGCYYRITLNDTIVHYYPIPINTLSLTHNHARLHCVQLLPMIVGCFIRAMNNRSILNIYFISIWMKFTSPSNDGIKPNTARFSKTYINNSGVFSNSNPQV